MAGAACKIKSRFDINTETVCQGRASSTSRAPPLAFPFAYRRGRQPMGAGLRSPGYGCKQWHLGGCLSPTRQDPRVTAAAPSVLRVAMAQGREREDASMPFIGASLSVRCGIAGARGGGGSRKPRRDPHPSAPPADPPGSLLRPTPRSPPRMTGPQFPTPSHRHPAAGTLTCWPSVASPHRLFRHPLSLHAQTQGSCTLNPSSSNSHPRDHFLLLPLSPDVWALMLGLGNLPELYNKSYTSRKRV